MVNVEMHFHVYFIGFLTSCLMHCAVALTLQEYKLEYVNYIIDCSSEFPISKADIESLRQNEIPDDMNVKCLLGCVYKKSGMMDTDGKLSIEGIKKKADEIFADDPDLRKRSEEFTEACKYVNDEEINGDKKECERARMIFQCSVEKGNKFTLAT